MGGQPHVHTHTQIEVLDRKLLPPHVLPGPQSPGRSAILFRRTGTADVVGGAALSFLAARERMLGEREEPEFVFLPSACPPQFDRDLVGFAVWKGKGAPPTQKRKRK